ncbi:MAG: bifunctional glutamate N-acetyltransferase/amino-acid acetyltransferase ArgJ [Phycisphaerae bacterium]|nr:bifunctional glutamate N-acetyltransferase/amino-acid acetyltransferase ArgJ [Phycisphaerae bacterium]
MPNETLTSAGFKVGSAAAGIKSSGGLDVGVVVSETPCAAAAVFTSNRFCGAPVTIGRQHVHSGRLRAIVVNSGCSNVATGKRGLDDARAMCARLAGHIDAKTTDILPASTGVIGAFLPMDKVLPGIDAAFANLSNSPKAGNDFARAIMTTDLRPKTAFRKIRVGRKDVVVAGCCKGSGMIAPNMATMLAFLGTTAPISPSALRRALRDAVGTSFNRVTVDECESTSDTVVLLANAQSGIAPIRNTVAPAYRAFALALKEVCQELAYQIAADGEGATRVIEVAVRGAATATDAHEVARIVAISPLFRTAVHGGDPNWGRIMQAIGTSRARFETDRIVVRICGQTVFRNGRPVESANLARISRDMKAKHVPVLIDLRAGKVHDRVLTCDLTKDYITINADYHT